MNVIIKTKNEDYGCLRRDEIFVKIENLAVVSENQELVRVLYRGVNSDIFSNERIRVRVDKEYRSVYILSKPLKLRLYEKVYPAESLVEKMISAGRTLDLAYGRDNVSSFRFSELVKSERLKELFNFYLSRGVVRYRSKVRYMGRTLRYHPELKNPLGVLLKYEPFLKITIDRSDPELLQEAIEISPMLFEDEFVLEKLSYHRFLGFIRFTFRNRETQTSIEVSDEYSPMLYNLFIKKYSLEEVAKAILKDDKEIEKDSGKSAQEWADILLDPEKRKKQRQRDLKAFAEGLNSILNSI